MEWTGRPERAELCGRTAPMVTVFYRPVLAPLYWAVSVEETAAAIKYSAISYIEQ